MNAVHELNTTELAQIEGGVVPILVAGAVVILAGMAFTTGVMVGLVVGSK